MSNEDLYKDPAVTSKYAAMTTRVRQLNIPERKLIDHYQLWNKKILILGSGAGRVPANLLLFGNTVTGIELSTKLHNVALSNYPPDLFPNLSLINADARYLNKIQDASFDCVFFPMNGIDLAPTLEDRNKILREMSKKTARGGCLHSQVTILMHMHFQKKYHAIAAPYELYWLINLFMIKKM